MNAIDHHPFLVCDFTNALLVLAAKERPLGLRRLKLVGVASDNWCLDGLISVFEQGGLPDLADLGIHGYGERKQPPLEERITKLLGSNIRLERFRCDIEIDEAEAHLIGNSIAHKTNFLPFLRWASVQGIEPGEMCKLFEMRRRKREEQAGVAAAAMEEERKRPLKARVQQLEGQVQTLLTLVDSLQRQIQWGRGDVEFSK